MKTLYQRATEVVFKWSRETGILSPDGSAYENLEIAIMEALVELSDDVEVNTKSLIMKEMDEKLGVPYVDVGLPKMKPEDVMGFPKYDTSEPTLKWEPKTELPKNETNDI